MKSIGDVAKDNKRRTTTSGKQSRGNLEKDGCSNECEVCGGASFIRLDVPVKDHRFGKIFPCPNLPITDRRFDKTGLSREERTKGWNDVLDIENIHEAIDAINRIIKRGYGMMYIYGLFGLGKTLLLKVAIAEALRMRKNVLEAKYVLMPEMLDDLRAAYSPNPQSGKSASEALKNIMDYYKGIELLCIDEMGVERDTSFGTERQFMIINDRYERAIERLEDGVMTIIAGNANVNELPGRIADRFKDGRCELVELTGSSFRLSQEPLK